MRAANFPEPYPYEPSCGIVLRQFDVFLNLQRRSVGLNLSREPRVGTTDTDAVFNFVRPIKVSIKKRHEFRTISCAFKAT